MSQVRPLARISLVRLSSREVLRTSMPALNADALEMDSGVTSLQVTVLIHSDNQNSK